MTLHGTNLQQKQKQALKEETESATLSEGEAYAELLREEVTRTSAKVEEAP